MTVPDPQLTIIVPALNEEDNIRVVLHNTLAAFDSFRIPGEVLVVDDGSTDRTAAIVREEMDRDGRVRSIRHPSPQGLGAAFWDGVAHARGEAVCLMPGDNENDPCEILRYYPLLEHVDVVIPFVFDKAARSFLRNALSRAYRFIVNTTFLTHFNYTNGTILYRRALLEALDFRCNSFFFQTDILIRLARRGYLCAEVPYRLNSGRVQRPSKAISLRSFVGVARGYLRLLRDVYLRRGRGPANLVSDSQTARRRLAA